ncbi:MAG: murein biosynthesis integral membrane protein MurJ [Candidatus Bipolaricaulota bacterium]|nr:murein biosynthesis integral membrane protein MurJ [Candidatus Bipolaricaulota bacterium]
MRRLSRDILVMAVATGISRVFGLVREAAIADRFGTSGAYDAFLIAFFLPHFLRELLAEGALSTAFVSVYTETLVTDKEANRLASNLLSILMIVFPVVVLAGVFLAPHYLPFLASGFSPAKLSLAIRLAQVLFPFIALVGFAAVFMGILNAHRRFFVPSLAPVLLNLGMIAGALFLGGGVLKEPIYGLAFGALLGGAAELVLQVPSLYRAGFRFRFALTPLHPGIRKMARLMAPAVLSLAVTEINLLVDNKFASHLGDGGISSLQYAMRLFALPLGIFGVSIGTALLPRFSENLARNENEQFSSHLRRGVSLTVFVLLPAVAGLYAIGPATIRLLFEHGSFSAASTLRAAHALSFYLVGLLPYGLIYLFTRAFYAMGRTTVPLVASVASLATNAVLDWLLVGPMREGGLALATSIAGALEVVVLVVFLWRAMRPDAKLTKELVKVACGAGLTFLAAWGVARWVGQSSRLLAVALPAIVGIGIYAAYARASGLMDLVRARGGDRSE